MAGSDKVASNFIVKTSLRAPTGTGLERVKTALTDIHELMKRINSQKVNISVNLTGADQAVNALKAISVAAENQLKRIQAKQRKSLGSTGQGGVSSGNPMAGRGVQPGPAGAPPSRRQGKTTQTRYTVSAGGAETYTTVRERRQGTTGVKNVVSNVLDPETGEFKRASATEIRNDDARKAELARQRQLALRPQVTGYSVEDAKRRLAEREAMGQQLASSARSRGLGVTTSTGRSILAGPDSTERLNGQIIRFTKTLADGSLKVREFDTLTGKLSKSFIEQTDASRARIAAIKRETEFTDAENKLRRRQIAGDVRMSRGVNAGFTNLPDETTMFEPVKGDSRKLTSRRRSQVRQNADGTDTVRTYDEATGKLTTRIIQNTEAIRNNRRVQELQNNALTANRHILDLQSQGFTRASESTKNFTVGTQNLTTSVTEFRRITGSALTGNLAVEIAKVDSETGRLTQTALSGSKAMRYLGDSFTNAVAKVGLWFAATTAIFLFAKGAREAVSQMQELEANTIFLARVGQALGSNFQDRLGEARLLTTGITEMSAAIGVDAIASQRAAAVFLRAGQDRIQALESTKAAMMAAKIAELEVEDAAKLLASAQKQFNLSSSQLLPTLDSLNSLSNKYVVSTNDLLQAISRAGKVYADSNGHLEGLAATTAIVAQTTRRSGAEIGNAIKTIQSRLASPEVSGTLMEKLGVSLYDAEGRAKDLTKVLMQLQSAMIGLSDAQKNQLMVTIAGARQVNILRNAMENVVDIALAEAQALRDSGSATEESIESSSSLTSALGRLKGQFTALVDSANNSAVSSMISGFVNLLSLILRMANAFDGLGVKVALLSTVFIGILAITYRYGAQISLAATLTRQFMVQLVSTGNAANAYAAAMNAAGISTQRFAVSLGYAIAITGALMLLAVAINGIAESISAAEIAAEKMAKSFNDAAESANREHRAIQTLTAALEEQIAIQRRLNELKKKGVDVSKEEEKVKKNVQSLGSALGWQGMSSYSGTEGELQWMESQAANERKKAGKEEAKAILDQIGLQKELLRKKKEEVALTRTPQQIQDDINAGKNVNENNVPLDKELEKSVNLRKQERDIQTQILELEVKKAAAIKSSNTDPLSAEDAKRVVRGNKAIRDFEQFEKTRVSENSLSTGSGFMEMSNLEEQYYSLDDIKNDLMSVAKGFQAGSAEAEKYAEQLNKVVIEQEKIRYSVNSLAIKQMQNAYSDKFSSSSAIETSFSASRSQLDFARTQGKGKGGMRFEGYNAIKSEIEAAKRNAMDRQKTIPNILGSGMSNIEKIAAVNAQQKQVADLLAKAREGEVRAAQELLKIELEITKERINQNKEAAKAAGLLSDEDKIRLLMQQDFFNKNPQKKLTKMDAFFADSTSNSLVNQFNPSRLDFDPNDPNNARFDNFFGKDFGIDQSLIEAEAELKKRGLGANSPDAQRALEFDAARDRTNGLRDTQSGLSGEDIVSNVMTGVTNINAQIDLNNPITAKDFKPLIDSFNNAVTVEMTRVRNEMIAYIKSIWKPIQDAGLDRQGLPPISQQ